MNFEVAQDVRIPLPQLRIVQSLGAERAAQQFRRVAAAPIDFSEFSARHLQFARQMLDFRLIERSEFVKARKPGSKPRERRRKTFPAVGRF
jgi:hypothetical protein